MSELIDIVVPSAGESVTEAQVSAILTPTGTVVSIDEPILELETDKASMPVNAFVAGRVTVLIQEGDTVKVGDVVARIDPSAVGEASAPVVAAQPASAKVAPAAKAPAVENKKSPAPADVPKTVASPVSVAPSHQAGSAGPAAANLMASANLRAEHVVGSGRGGRITKEDVIFALKNPRALSLPAPPMPNLGHAASLPQPIHGGRETRTMRPC
jgi:2-oxoglutarate dehydrogenase E2 component (dihydrolipoamide succinyltransferase)